MGGVRADAEDALSRAMLRAFEKLKSQAAEVVNLRAWLTTLTYHLCMDIHRERAGRELSVGSLEQVSADEADARAGDALSPEDTYSRAEEGARLRRAVDELPHSLREPFMLRFFDEMEYDEIARRLGLTPANVRKRIQQARTLLRKKLRRSP